jgi:hypothetical protein
MTILGRSYTKKLAEPTQPWQRSTLWTQYLEDWRITHYQSILNKTPSVVPDTYSKYLLWIGWMPDGWVYNGLKPLPDDDARIALDRDFMRLTLADTREEEDSIRSKYQNPLALAKEVIAPVIEAPKIKPPVVKESNSHDVFPWLQAQPT